MSTTTRMIALADELTHRSHIAGQHASIHKGDGDNTGYWMYVGAQDAYAAAANLVLGLVEVETIGEEVAS